MTGTWRCIAWFALALAIAVALVAAAHSPLLAWREPVYIVACFAGIVALGAILAQPLFVAGYLSGLQGPTGRHFHRWVGAILVAAVVVHVAGLWITSPPDMVDALLFASPTPFSAWGVVAMWALFSAGLLASLRRRLPISPRIWRLAHTSVAILVVLGSVAHALLIEGIMESVSKAVLCTLVLGSTVAAIIDIRTRRWRLRRVHRRSPEAGQIAENVSEM